MAEKNEMIIVLASHNKKKLAEMRTIMSGISPNIRVISASELDFDAEVEETGSTFEENAALKAGFIASHGYWAIADDSGLCVDALDGKPGVYSARYSGGNDSDNIDKLLDELNGVPDDKRTAKFVCCIVMAGPDGERFTALGECGGNILHERRGDDGFGYDPVFLCPKFGRTFAELSSDEKNSVSHRGIAMGKLAEYIARRFGK